MGRRDHILLYPVHEKPNLLANARFDTLGAGGADVFANWGEINEGTSTISADDTVKRTGPYACKLHFPDGNNVYVYQVIGTVGLRYKVSLWLKTASAGLFVYAAHGTASQALTTTGTDWQKFVFFLTCATNNVFKISRNGAAGTAWIDDVLVQKV